MSYVQQRSDPRSRATAVLGVVAVHAGIAAIVITGLTVVGYIQPKKQEFGGGQIPLPPPPKPPEPEPSQSAVAKDPVILVPLPPLPLPPKPGPKVETTDDASASGSTLPPGPSPTPTALPEPPKPLPTFTPRLARPANSQATWVTTDDYPAMELKREVEGTVRYRLSVGSNGRVTACEVLATSGSARLDDAACRNITRRARFEPATNEAGEKVVGTFTGTVRWEIPD